MKVDSDARCLLRFGLMRSVKAIPLFLLAGLAYAWLVTSLGEVSAAYFDSLQYLQYGRNLLEQGIYGFQSGEPDMNREPGYGVFLAGLLWLVKSLGLVRDLAAAAEPANVIWLKTIQAYVLFLSAAACAFLGAFPARVRKPFFLVVILSPTCIGAVREIYSEALAIPLSLLLLCFVSRALSSGGVLFPALAGALFGAMVLTKSYFHFASYVFLLAFIFFRGRQIYEWAARRVALRPLLRFPVPLLLFCLFLGGFLSQQAWSLRNARLFGANASEARLSIALAGKVARLDRARWGKDLGPAIAASLGTNFCDKLYNPERCSLFDYRGCDVIGNEVRLDYENRLPTKTEADSSLKRDMVKLWFARPFTQLFGSGLELLRMFFFEAVLDAGTLPSLLQVPARAWHIVGSLAFWCLILVSFTRHRRHWGRLPQVERQLALFCLALLAYHAAMMAQITNVVRYVFPILPFLYYFTADGIAVFIERKRAWTYRPKK